MRKVILCFICLIGILALNFCEKAKIKPYKKQLFLYGEFENQPSSIPSIDLDLEKSSNEIKINDNARASIESGRILMEFRNIRIEDSLGVYQIKDIITEEFREGEWVQDSENFLRSERTKSLSVVLVLDVSSSLGRDVIDVKDYARDFVNSLFEDIPEPQVGIVGFSEEINIQPLTTNKSKATNFISNLKEGKDATKLYEAMDTGLSIIDTVSTTKGKSLVTFTDGRNNSWTDVKYENDDHIYNRLSSKNINSYTIGLKGKGGVDKEVLKDLSVNNGLYQFPENTEGVKNVFNKFAASVSSTYRLIYDRNNSPITNPINLRFRIKTTLK